MKKKERKSNPILDMLAEVGASVRSPYGYKKCTRCGGTGHVMLPPFYAKEMPEPTEYPCEECNGRGRVYVVPAGIAVVREKSNEYY